MDLAIDLVFTVGDEQASKASNDGGVGMNELTGVATDLKAGAANPGGTVSIHFGLAERSNVKVSVYDVAGRRVRTLLDESLSAGLYTRAWDGMTASGARAATGIYLIRMQTGSHDLKRKVLLAR